MLTTTLLVLSYTSAPALANPPPDTGYYEETFDTADPCGGDTGCVSISAEELLTAYTLFPLRVFPGMSGEVIQCDGGFVDDADSDWTVTPYSLDGVNVGRYHQMAAESNDGQDWMIGVQPPFGQLEGSGYDVTWDDIPTDDYYWGVDLGNTGKASGVDAYGFVHVWGVGGADLDGDLTNSGYIWTSLGRNTVCASGRVNGGVDCASLEEPSLVTNVDRPTTGTCPRVGAGRYSAVAVCDGYLHGWGKNTSAVNSFLANIPNSYGWKNVDVASYGNTFGIAWAQDNTVTVWAGTDGTFPDAIRYSPGWTQCRTSASSRVYQLQYYEGGSCHPLKVRMMPDLNEYNISHVYGLVVLEGGSVYPYGTPLIIGGASSPVVVDETCTDL